MYFKVKDDEEMDKTVESIKQFGVLNPVIVRPLEEERLAEKLNISRIHLAHIEIGSKAPSIDLMIVLAQFFGVTLDYLVLGR